MSTISKKMMTMLVVLLVAGAVSAAEIGDVETKETRWYGGHQRSRKAAIWRLHYGPHAGRNDNVGPSCRDVTSAIPLPQFMIISGRWTGREQQRGPARRALPTSGLIISI